MLSWVIRALRTIKRFLKYQIIRGINKPYYRFHHVSRFSFHDPGDAGAFQCVLCLSGAAVQRGGSPGQFIGTFHRGDRDSSLGRIGSINSDWFFIGIWYRQG